MTIDKFAQLVAEMRAAQKRFFQLRGNDDLQRSKQLEREVDLTLREKPWQENRLLGGLEAD